MQQQHEAFGDFTNRLIHNSLTRFHDVVAIGFVPMIGQELAMLTELLLMRFGPEVGTVIAARTRMLALERNGYCSTERHSGIDVPPSDGPDHMCAACRKADNS